MFPIRKSYCAILLLMMMSCQSYDRSAKLKLFNRTEKDVYYYVTCDSSFEDLQLKSEYLLKPRDSARPYLLYGPEGQGPDKNPWVNAINRADDTALHIFFYYIDFKKDRRPRDSVFPLIIQRFDYKVAELNGLGWRIEYAIH